MAASRSRKQTPGQKMLAGLTKGKAGHLFKAGGHEARLVVAEINPEMASQIIDVANIRNRKVRQKKVAEFASVMKSGRWLLQNPMIFSASGELIDGQHRLLAVIESDTPVAFLAQITEPKVARSVNLATDSGTPRNLADMLHFNAVPDASRVAPVLVLERNYRIAHSPFQSSDSEKLDYLKLFRSIGDETFKVAFDAVPRGLHTRLSVKRAVIDWLALQLVQIDPGHAHLFFGLTSNPSSLKETDAPYVLSQRMLELASKRSRIGKAGLPPIEQGTMFVKAWNCYYTNAKTKPSDINYRVREDFPLINGAQ